MRERLPFLKSLSNADRIDMPKMAEKSIGFDEKCAGYMASHPEFLPGFIDPAEVAKDRALRASLLEFAPDLATLTRALDDTLMLVSSEVWMADLAYYQSVREAARRNREGADVIYAELRPRFPGSSASPAPTIPA